MLLRTAASHPGPLRNNPYARPHTQAHALRSPKAAAAMNEPKRAKLGSRNSVDATMSNPLSTSTLAAAAALTGGGAAATAAGASVVPPSSRPPPACLSHEIVDSFNVPGEKER